jgi:hypothetical protein
MLKFQPCYFILAAILFITEVLIAIFVHDSIIRPYIGDLLVVILLYCLIQSFFDLPVGATAIGVLLFSYTIELLQYFKIVKVLGLQHNTLAKVIIGTSFAWLDLVMYTLGIVLVLLVEKKAAKQSALPPPSVLSDK